uniref:Uncharacterized protein ORF CE007 n=1 Tax=Staphylococcus aureus TaxID=1280 RepID=Q9LC01_STAAU|nr:hypothetical protein R99_30 [Staphylococcus aureus]BAA94321.1 hypothetical protein [Staphylococcus aureus]BAM14626.1 hypothetical protein [Staphylococcus aureus]BAU45647.1 hypothetical protein [Staphylococcus aureus]CBY88818.1 hypothetical protein [Staphylococcus aureus]
MIVNGILQYYLKKLTRMLLFDQIILLKSYFFRKKTSIIIYANILQIKRHFLVSSIMKKKLLNSIHKVSL